MKWISFTITTRKGLLRRERTLCSLRRDEDGTWTALATQYGSEASADGASLDQALLTCIRLAVDAYELERSA